MDPISSMLGRFVQAGQAAQSAIDRALERGELVRLIRDRRATLESLRDNGATLEALSEAQFDVTDAELDLEDFDARRAPA